MPTVASYAQNPHAPKPSATLDVDGTSVEIWLPSSIRSSDQSWLQADYNKTGMLVVDAEKVLRLAQLQDSLDAIKRLLKTKLSTKDYTWHNLFGQRSNTRAQSALSSVDKKINDRAAQYQRAYSALLILDPDGNWRKKFQLLINNDLRVPLRDHHRSGGSNNERGVRRTAKPPRKKKNGALAASGQGYRTESWIWSVQDATFDSSATEASDSKLISFFSAPLTSFQQKFYASCGHKERLELSIGRKKSLFYLRRCGVLSYTVTGSLRGGRSAWYNVQVRLDSLMELRHTHISRPICGELWLFLLQGNGHPSSNVSVFLLIGHLNIRSIFQAVCITLPRPEGNFSIASSSLL